MQGQQEVYHLRVDMSGRIVLPANIRTKHRISEGDTIVVTDEPQGLRIRTKNEVIAEAQKYFATLAPSDVLLSEELLRDRRSEIERD